MYTAQLGWEGKINRPIYKNRKFEENKNHHTGSAWPRGEKNKGYN